MNRSLQRNAEIESYSRFYGEPIKVAHPIRVHTSGDVARKCGVNVAVAKNNGARFEQRKNAAFRAIGEIGGMNQRESGRREHFFLLAELGGVFYERRGIPFVEDDAIAFRLEPFVKKAELGGLPGTIYALDDE